MRQQAQSVLASSLCVVLLLVVSFRAYAITPKQLAVVFNANDPVSRDIARYYQQKRRIPRKNMIAVELPSGKAVISQKVFNRVYTKVTAATPKAVQFYALAWSEPYRVGCMSVTSAFAFGFDKKYCAIGCKPTAASAYYNSDSEQPYADFKIRPSMMLAGSSLDEIKSMIDRGVRSDYTHPNGTAYLLSTHDKFRNVRARIYPAILSQLGDRLPIQILVSNELKHKKDVMFYFTGLSKVADIKTNKFLDGAIADHLTSAGGILFNDKQMSILRWLDAGATASYGTVVEPCNFIQKFPNPEVVIDHYTRGESLIESYWKSVRWPGQGVFVGEPMAKPYADKKAS